jgi:hypothetical protein
LPEEEFRLFAVCARYPHNLAQLVPWTAVQPGVYDCQWATEGIRVIVLGQLPQSEHNAMLHLFSAAQEQVRYGAQHYRQRADDTSTLLQRLFEQYRKEGVNMPYTMEDFRRDYVKEHLKDLTPEEIRAVVPPEELLKGLPPEERLAGLAPEERLAGLSLEERLAGFSPEEIAALLKRLQAGDSSPKAE